MGHIVLLGDSIFDNASYVPDRPAVVDQVRRGLPAGWEVTLLAMDGHLADDVHRQLTHLPVTATHLFISAGGCDALEGASVIQEPVPTMRAALERLAETQDRFRESYRKLLRAVLDVGKPVHVCTIYDAVPDLTVAERMALSGYNEVILREAFIHRLGVIDLRLVCDQPGDYSHVSSIEPSMVGGGKIARLITEIATGKRSEPHSVIYA